MIRLARQIGATPTQIALAWLLSQGPRVLPLVGTTNLAHIEEALGTLDLPLGSVELDGLRKGV